MIGRRPAPRTPVALALLAGTLLGSCALPPRPMPMVDDLAARFRAERTLRADRVQALTADVLVRVDGRATGRLPGLPATLALAAPDRARLRVSAFFGTAVDVCARGDSLFAWVPSERLALALAGAGETLGIATPVGLLARAVGATWDPPGEAWKAAVAESLGLRLAWREGADSLALLVDRDARPAEVRLAGAAGSVAVRYSGWSRAGGAEWPGWIELRDGTDWARVRIGVEQLRVVERADDAWFALRLPDDARRLGWDELRDWLDDRREGR